MTELYYTVLDGTDLNIAGLPLSDYRIKRISDSTNPQKIKQGICSELLLNIAVKKHIPYAKLPLDISLKGLKPVISQNLYFSLSHSHEIAACAISNNDIGLDVQKEIRYSSKLSEKIFSAAEYAEYKSVNYSSASFFRLWTMKESYLKFLGTGITHETAKYCVFGSTSSDLVSFPKFWYNKKDSFHFSICSTDPQPTEIIYIPMKKLLL